jgi:hypothetical protein
LHLALEGVDDVRMVIRRDERILQAMPEEALRDMSCTYKRAARSLAALTMPDTGTGANLAGWVLI